MITCQFNWRSGGQPTTCAAQLLYACLCLPCVHLGISKDVTFLYRMLV